MDIRYENEFGNSQDNGTSIILTRGGIKEFFNCLKSRKLELKCVLFTAIPLLTAFL